MTGPAPDLAGFADAQRRLRGGFGEDVVFLLPEEVTFPPDVPIDPETGLPYDPTIKPIASGAASAVVNCDVAQRTTRLDVSGGDNQGQLGVLTEGQVLLIADISASATIADAVRFEVRGDSYKVMSMRPDGIGGAQRWLTTGRRG